MFWNRTRWWEQESADPTSKMGPESRGWRDTGPKRQGRKALVLDLFITSTSLPPQTPPCFAIARPSAKRQHRNGASQSSSRHPPTPPLVGVLELYALHVQSASTHFHTLHVLHVQSASTHFHPLHCQSSSLLPPTSAANRLHSLPLASLPDCQCGSWKLDCLEHMQRAVRLSPDPFQIVSRSSPDSFQIHFLFGKDSRDRRDDQAARAATYKE